MKFLEEPNIFIYISSLRINLKKTFEKEIKSVIQVSQNNYLLANDYGYIIYDIQQEKIKYEKDFQTKIKPQYICLKNNNIILLEMNHVYIIKIDVNKNVYSLDQKLRLKAEWFSFCQEAPFFCFIDKNKIFICKFKSNEINFEIETKEYTHCDKVINSIIFTKPEEILVLSNGKNLQYFNFK